MNCPLLCPIADEHGAVISKLDGRHHESPPRPIYQWSLNRWQWNQEAARALLYAARGMEKPAKNSTRATGPS